MPGNNVKRVSVLDTTLRDGAQREGISFSVKDKLRIAQKLDESIQKAAKKNAVIDVDNFKELAPRLEFADLRELQQIITSTATWARFEPRFVNKEGLNAKFGQLAELRNGIRHSRAVDEITRKEGEASILWFEQVLKK